MDQVVIGRGSPTATFRSISHSATDDPYVGGSFVIELRSEDFRVERGVFMFSFDWGGLVAFFSDLADCGGDGTERSRGIPLNTI